MSLHACEVHSEAINACLHELRVLSKLHSTAPFYSNMMALGHNRDIADLQCRLIVPIGLLVAFFFYFSYCVKVRGEPL